MPRKKNDFSFEDLYKNHTRIHADTRKYVYENTTDLSQDPTFKFINNVTSYIFRDSIDQTHLNTSMKQLELLIDETVNTIYNIENAIRSVSHEAFARYF